MSSTPKKNPYAIRTKRRPTSRIYMQMLTYRQTGCLPSKTRSRSARPVPRALFAYALCFPLPTASALFPWLGIFVTVTFGLDLGFASFLLVLDATNDVSQEVPLII